MTLERDIDILTSIPFFEGIPMEPMKLLAFSADPRDFADKARIFSSGDVADGGYVILDGRIDLVDERKTPPKVVERLGAGVLLGETALIVETRRPVSAIAVGSCRVLGIRRALFRRMLEGYPEVAALLQARIADRLTALSPEIERIGERMAAVDRG
ncbi:MAG: Crp/Fnr family transcriptional regulator [Siculibacillus sp.]